MGPSCSQVAATMQFQERKLENFDVVRPVLKHWASHRAGSVFYIEKTGVSGWQTAEGSDGHRTFRMGGEGSELKG